MKLIPIENEPTAKFWSPPYPRPGGLVQPAAPIFLIGPDWGRTVKGSMNPGSYGTWWSWGKNFASGVGTSPLWPGHNHFELPALPIRGAPELDPSLGHGRTG